MNPITHNLLPNQQYDLPYGGAIPWLQKKHRALSSQGHPSFCPVTGLDSKILNPYQQADGYNIILCSVNDEDTRNSTNAAHQTIAFVDGGYVDLNCTDNANGGGNVTTDHLSCRDADTFYKHEAETSDLEMLASWWNPQCCFTKSDIHKYWWDAMQEYRKGPSLGGRNGTIIRGVMSMISVISSSTLIWMLRRSHGGLSTTQNRVLLGLCVSDIIFSFSYLHFGMFVPKEVDYYSWNARGNMATCHIAGFFATVGSGLGPFYNASLCVLLLAIVKYEKSDEYIRNKIEPFLHGVPLLMSFGVYIFALAMGNVNPNGSGSCTLSPYYPPHCSGMEDGSTTEGLFDVPCGRGNRMAAFYTASLYLIIPPIVMITCLTMIYRCVLIIEKNMFKYGARSMSIDETSSASLRILGLLKQCLLLQCSSCKKGKPATNSRAQQRKRERPSHSRQVMYKGLAYSCSWLLSWGSLFVICFSGLIGAKAPYGFLIY